MSELQLKTRNLLIRAAVDRTGTHFFRLHREFAACEANFNLIEATGDEKLLDLTEIKNWEAIGAELGSRLAAAEKPAPRVQAPPPPVVVSEPVAETEEERSARLRKMSPKEIREQLTKEHDERVRPKDTHGFGINRYTGKAYLPLPEVDEQGRKIDRKYLHRMPSEEWRKFQTLYGSEQLEKIYNGGN